MSPRRLFGWEPAKVTEFTRDKSGRIIRSVTRGESEWSDDDREMLLGYQQRQRTLLSHGVPIDEATDPKADPNYYGEGAYRYEAHFALDQAQAAMDRERARLRAQNPEMDLGAYVFMPVRKDYSAAAIPRSESELASGA